MKELFVVTGAQNSGKTHTVRYIAEKLVVRYMGKQWDNDYITPLKVDVAIKWGTPKGLELVGTVTISFNKEWLEEKKANDKEKSHFAKIYEGNIIDKSVKIGVCTLGDNKTNITKDINSLIQDNCDIIICACQYPYANLKETPDKLYQDLIKNTSSYNQNIETVVYNQYKKDPAKYDIANKILDKVCGLIDREMGLNLGVNTFFHVSELH